MSQKHLENLPPDFGRVGTIARVGELGLMCYGLAEADNGKLWVATVGALALGATVAGELVMEFMHSFKSDQES